MRVIVELPDRKIWWPIDHKTKQQTIFELIENVAGLGNWKAIIGEAELIGFHRIEELIRDGDHIK